MDGTDPMTKRLIGFSFAICCTIIFFGIVGLMR